MVSPFIMFFIASCCIATVYCQSLKDRTLAEWNPPWDRLNAAQLSDNSWDHYILAESTPPGACYIHKLNGEEGACKYPSNSTLWTIHGLWPTLENLHQPNWCGNCSWDAINCTNATLDENEMADLLPQLAMFWPNVKIDTPYYQFWRHEWLKHGTCSGMSQKDYFSKVLSLFKNGFNFANILTKSGVVPLWYKPYEIHDFILAFWEHLGVKPQLECLYKKLIGWQTLHQIKICLTKNFQPIDCPEPTNRSGLCWPTEPIHYVPSVPYYV